MGVGEHLTGGGGGGGSSGHDLFSSDVKNRWETALCSNDNLVVLGITFFQ